ncbi:uncharacterized protein [Mobula birostris]|uniref:uncharacterized protein isoform X2 n=1 Tax=Mobula birostris TaxID=1983395 RepID=UPI003B28217E
MSSLHITLLYSPLGSSVTRCADPPLLSVCQRMGSVSQSRSGTDPLSVGPKKRQPRVMSLLNLRIFSLLRLFSFLLQLGVISAEAEREEVVGVLGSSVLLDPEITVDSSKNDILWTFKASNKSHDVILMHIPGVATWEPSEQFKDRLQFNALSGALTINRLNASDQGDYTFSVDGKELKIMELLVIDKVKEEVGLLGSAVLLDPELKVDPSKSEILWTFISRNILHHVPGHGSVEPSDQFKFRLHFDTSNGALTVNEAEDGDQGDYSFIVDGQELRKIQLHLFDKVKEEVGLLGSAVLLDPELKVDPSKSEILWTFISRSILHHVPGHSLVELSDQFKFRLHFDTSNGALTVDGAEDGDQGDYTFIVDGQELRIIQLHLFDELSEGSILTNVESLGFTVELTCDVTGDSNVYQWQKNGGEISQHHQLTDENSTLVIPSASFEDCGVYTCITINPVSSIQTNYTLMLRGFSLKDIIMIAVLTAGQVISAPSLHSAILPDQWRWQTLGGHLGYRFYLISLSICNTLSFTAMYIMLIYWFVVEGISPLDFVVVAVMIIGLRLSSIYIYLLPRVTGICEILEGSHAFRIWLKWKSVYNIILRDCFIVAWIVSATISGFSTTEIVVLVFAILLPIVLYLILKCRVIKRELDKGDSIKDTLINALWKVVQILPIIGVIYRLYLVLKNPQKVIMFFGSNLIFLFGISVSNSIPGFYSKDIVTFAASITMVVVFLVAFILYVILWWTGLGREDVGVAVTSMVGLVFSTAYAIIFMCWLRKGSPDDKQWWWRLNICNIVVLVFILITLICWIVSKDQSCKINIPLWIILTVSGITFVTTLSRFFPVCSKNEGTNENNRGETEQDPGEMPELQPLGPGHEAEPENHPVS